MPEEEQDPKATPTDSGSSPAEAQPQAAPSTTEAGAAAAEPSPTAETGAAEDLLAREQRRLSRLQSAKDTQIAEERRTAQEALQRAQALEAQVNELRMQGMTQEERAKFVQEQRERKYAQREKELADKQAELEEREYTGYWYSQFIADGVPRERLNECRNFAEMFDAYREYMHEQAEKTPEAPAGAATPPPVTPKDQVQAGGIGAPPSREIDKLIAEGHGPGTKEFRDLLKRQRRSGRSELL